MISNVNLPVADLQPTPSTAPRDQRNSVGNPSKAREDVFEVPSTCNVTAVSKQTWYSVLYAGSTLGIAEKS